MDQVAGRYRAPECVLKDAVRAAADAANRLVDLLQVEIDQRSDEAMPHSEFGSLIDACEATWPVEGGNAQDVVKATALLLVLRRLVSRFYGAQRLRWHRPAQPRDAAHRLTELEFAAEEAPGVDEVLRSLDNRLPRDLPDLLATTAEAKDALLPPSIVYEQLLTQFDRRQRSARGVFHTPASVANWMVRAVYQLVDLYCASADRLRFVDMGCGCGTFLYEAMRQWRLEPNVHSKKASFLGYEVIPTAYAMANWLVGSGAATTDLDELDIRWTNPLIAGETERRRILQPNTLPILIGNPPYANFGRANRGPWIDRLLRDYKSGLEERKSNLNDDFIRFIRWGQHWIDGAGQGILAVVTSRTYLAGITHRQMRRSLLDSFDRVYIVDLHGDQAAQSDSPEPDENVFDVRSGITIGLFIKTGNNSATSEAKYHSLRGARADKLAWLRSTAFHEVPWRDSAPQLPAFNLSGSPSTCSKQSRLYESFWPLTRIFRQWISGVQTKNDSLFVDFDRNVLTERIKAWLQGSSSSLGSEKPAFDERCIQPYLLAPFDRRWLYYDRRVLGRPRYEVMRHMLQPNVGLVFMRQSTSRGEYDHFLAVNCLVSDRVFYSRHGAPYLAPLWLYASEIGSQTRTGNFTDEWMAAVTDRTDREPSAESIFDYLYAVVHQTSYRSQFASELRRDFPGVPVPSDSDQFDKLAALGSRLRHLHTTLCRAAAPAELMIESTARIGGYDVLQRWRKPRARRHLTESEVEYERRLEQVLQETARLRLELDGLSTSIS